MFGLGPTEMVVILVIALLIFGPTRLPKVAQSLGESVRNFRDSKDQVDEVKKGVQKHLEDMVLGPSETKK
ncbi:MAG TPA: twin-arginine translocase TatA/TatE family subunit [Candidatus Anoxymicrobiaceae bacterium]